MNPEKNLFDEWNGELNRFEHRGIECMVSMGSYSINGYLRLPAGHPWLAADEPWDLPDEAHDVHGGVTLYSKEHQIIGFDTNHLSDGIHPEGLHVMGDESLFDFQGHIWTEHEVKAELTAWADKAADAMGGDHD